MGTEGKKESAVRSLLHNNSPAGDGKLAQVESLQAHLSLCAALIRKCPPCLGGETMETYQPRVDITAR
ncbi:unnamed protein product [Pleuronectes platessa]|uniref:Uncharacterized protein n=1 Tax=Pleuronectes platessa TaxID=8262 RepID=A0A9N7TW57_PLEPL|nr:unnamed protein product [Pleuronectes platessa]